METRRVPGKLGKGFTYTNGDGYFFKINGRRNGNVYMKCTECNMRGKLEGERLIVNATGLHSHPPDYVTEKVLLLKQDCKEEAKKMLGGKIQSVFTQACDRADEGARSEITFESCRSSMYRARSEQHPPVPQDFEEFESSLVDQRYSDKYGKCPDGSLMTRGLVGPSGHRSLVFTSDLMLNIMVAALWLFIDGTFASRPDTPPSRQLLVISALYQGMVRNELKVEFIRKLTVTYANLRILFFLQLFPVCYALMESKSEVAYRALFAFVKDLAPSLAPENIVTDYEAAFVPVIRDVFPSTIHQGCWFHFCQALHRHLGFLGLITFVKRNFNALTVIRMCYVLPLLPSNKMIFGLNAIEYVAHMNGILGELQPFLDYVRETWMVRIGTDLVSVHRSKHRTNNFSESSHKALQDRIGTIRPGVWDFVSK
ncbi:uncharacterized protein LOC117642042 [Thrips palmi]|uniref:Uncharacterized protein LOC117642042 n=1 Tax=Thrips palmi TaxID=161013 RepID=A0A6P8YGP4_THRPL|nr:uncharacterized protein LOC117642042 [Thrips palmi]